LSWEILLFSMVLSSLLWFSLRFWPSSALFSRYRW
jgi:hypothetical protein